MVDQHHIDECSHLKRVCDKVTDIVKPLETVNSIWHLELGVLTEIHNKVRSLELVISELEGKEYVKVKACRILAKSNAP
jgi:hypothetical protein